MTGEKVDPAQMPGEVERAFNSAARAMQRRFGASGTEEDIEAALSEFFAPILAEKESLRRELHSLAVALHRKHYCHVKQWQPFDDALGLATQIDNMTAGLVPEARALAAEAALAAERGVNALTEGTLLRGLVAELARGQRSYPAAYQRGHTLVGFGLAEYADEPVENKSYWLRLTDAGHAIAAAIRAQGE